MLNAIMGADIMRGASCDVCVVNADPDYHEEQGVESSHAAEVEWLTRCAEPTGAGERRWF